MEKPLDNRRYFLIKSLLTISSFAIGKSFAQALNYNDLSQISHLNNFHYIYTNKKLRDEFYLFLKNVFNLYPEDILHKKIYTNTQTHLSDEKIYSVIQSQIADIKPFLSELSHALPALKKQKVVMRDQTKKLLDSSKKYQGYLEIGSTGRYLDLLEEEISINEERYFISDLDATYSPVDIIDRGQLAKPGTVISLNNYKTNYFSKIKKQSIDLATVYIGFHHCPINLRDEFISNLRDCMRTGSTLIVRDHNVDTMDMLKMVSLAHDVFNMGTGISISENKNELRNFYTLDFLTSLLEKHGFKFNGQKLLQVGDPTLNTLMSFRKV